METLKYYPLIDNTLKTELIKEQIQNKLSKSLNLVEKIEDSNVILVVGGDGYMLNCIHKYIQYKKLFFGINCGTLGFMMNKITNIDELPNDLNEIDIYQENCIETNILTLGNEIIIKYAINDIVIGGTLLDYLNFNINYHDKTKIITGTGLLISNAIGSTAYWLHLGGPLIPLKSNIWGIMGIATRPFKYTTIEPQIIKITPYSRNQIIVGVDGYQGKVNDVKKIILKPSVLSFEIGFKKTEKFETKRILLATDKL